MSLHLFGKLMSKLAHTIAEVLSAYFIILESVIEESLSLMYNENRTGAKIEPCGTPT